MTLKTLRTLRVKQDFTRIGYRYSVALTVCDYFREAVDKDGAVWLSAVERRYQQFVVICDTHYCRRLFVNLAVDYQTVGKDLQLHNL